MVDSTVTTITARSLEEWYIPPSEGGSSIVILTQTRGEEFPYSTRGRRPRVEYGNSSPRVWVRITILLPTSEGGMTFSLRTEYGSMGILKVPLKRILILFSL